MTAKNEWYVDIWNGKVGVFNRYRLPEHFPERPVMVYDTWPVATQIAKDLNKPTVKRVLVPRC